jgi:hypothetical protein
MADVVTKWLSEAKKWRSHVGSGRAESIGKVGGTLSWLGHVESLGSVGCAAGLAG